MKYSKEVIKHFNNPKNVGEIKNADGVGEIGNLCCGDVMRVFVKIKTRKIKNQNKINPNPGFRINNQQKKL